MKQIWRHMRALWPRWTLLPPLPFAAYFGFLAWHGGLRIDHFVVLAVVLALAYGNEATKRLCVGAYPIGLVALLFDAMKLIKNVGLSVDRVHLCDLREAELRWFGLTVGGERITLHDWFLAHHSPILDVYCGFPYGVYIFAALGFAVYLYFRDAAALERFAWAFFVLNMAGFVTYHVYPAAPPWYFHAHGCTIDLATSPSEGPALARVDALTGLHYFAGMYRRSSDVFGAMPSLHAAYPLLIALAGFRILGPLGRGLSLLFLVSMVFSAVYLDHHWVMDLLVGLVYGAASFAFVTIITARRARSSSEVSPAERPA